MVYVAALLVALVASAHVGFLVLEMFLWQGPIGRKVFGMSPERAATTAVLAKNQGLYNGFLAAGLAWGLLLGAQGAGHARDVLTFFLACVAIAGAYGAATVSRRILAVQSIPALIALLAVWLANGV